MKLVWQLSLIATMVILQACTGQEPASLKNSTNPRNLVKPSCSNIIFEGQVLSKKNILNIFECSGWSKDYPELTGTLRSANEKSINEALKIYNDSFFKKKSQRKSMYELISNSEDNGELNVLARLLEKSLQQHNLLGQLNRAFQTNSLDAQYRSSFMKVLSTDNESNLRLVIALKNIISSYELSKSSLNGLFNESDQEKLTERVAGLLDDFAGNMDEKSWGHLSGIVHDGESPIQKWAIESRDGDLRVLLNIIEHPTFFNDVTFLKQSIDQGITCRNRAHTTDFNIDVGHELKFKIDSLKKDSLQDFEKALLHGLTKYLAFQEFCEEKDRPQGVDAFYKVLRHAFKALSSPHDYNFLKSMHQVYGEDRFVFLSFLSSKSFEGLRSQLIDFKEGQKDQQFVSSLYEVLGGVQLSDLSAISEATKELSKKHSKSAQWFRSWSQYWKSLNQQEKKDFINFLGLLLSDELETSKAFSLAETLLKTFPEFTPTFSEALTEEAFQESVRYLIQLLADEKVQNELSVLFSQKGIFEFLEIITQQDSAQERRTEEARVARQSRPLTFVETRTPDQESIVTRTCFDDLSAKYEADPSYYAIVNDLPDTCKSVIGQIGFVGQIYLWMNNSHAFFEDTYQVDDFHSATGVWSPGMLQFIFSAAVEVNLHLRSADGKIGIKVNLEEIHRVLTHPDILKTFHLFSLSYKTVNEKLIFEPRLVEYFENQNNDQINNLISDSLELFNVNPAAVTINSTPITCSDLSSGLGANPCLSQDALSSELVKMLRLLKRKNEKGNSLIKELVQWLHPEAGISLPFGKKKTSVHATSLDEIVRFLNDISDPSTSKKFTYQTASGQQQVAGTILDRLEVVIRDIAFLNNFYGAYFKNDVAGARSYRKDVIASQRLLHLLDNSSGLFRGFRSMPQDSKWRLNNVRATYSSLIELSDTFSQADGSKRTYGPIIQSMLAAIASSSKLSTQDFNPYRIPNPRVVEGHNGIFLTKVMELSSLRHLSQFVRSHFDSKLTALNSAEFKQINANLIKRHSPEKLMSSIQRILDDYLDGDKGQLNLMIIDTITLLDSLNKSEQKALKEIAVKAMMLLSDSKVYNKNIEELAGLMELGIEMWPELREVLKNVDNREKLFSKINSLMDGLVKHPERINRLVTELRASRLFGKEDLRLLLKDKKFTEDFIRLLNHLTGMKDFSSTLNWLDVVREIFSPGETQWEPIASWIGHATHRPNERLTISLLIQFLGEKNAEGYRLKSLMDELFHNHRPMLERFLEETFLALQLKTD